MSPKSGPARQNGNQLAKGAVGWLAGAESVRQDVAGFVVNHLLTSIPSPHISIFGISNLQKISRQISEFKGLIRKIFRNKELGAAFGFWLLAWGRESMFFLRREDIGVFKVQLGDHEGFFRR